jgi:hypothetical protein
MSLALAPRDAPVMTTRQLAQRLSFAECVVFSLAVEEAHRALRKAPSSPSVRRIAAEKCS